MDQRIQKAAVIGAGTMGSAIAGYLAGAGIPCYLFDIVPEGAKDRNEIAKEAIKGLAKTRPPYLFSKEDTKRIIPGNIEDDLEKLTDADWIVEAVVEKLDIKRDLFSKIAPHRAENAIVSSNTSGISLEEMTEGMDDEFVEHFLITHFFNPVRYMRLLEIVKGPQTNNDVYQRFCRFAEYTLGKGLVFAKDTPNFIANRIGVYAKMLVIHEFASGDYTVEEIDQIFGRVLGRPKSAIFRTADIVGLDTTANVVKYLYSALPEDPEREVFTLPDFYEKMLEKEMLGQKTKAGFYKVKRTDEGKEILSLDVDTLEYSPQEKVTSESLKKARGKDEGAEKIRELILYGDDRLARLARKVTFKTLLYALSLIPEISDDIVQIDRAMMWGYNWDLGLFETWDALGVNESVKKMKEEGYDVPGKIEKILATGQQQFYITEGSEKKFYDFASEEYQDYPTPEYKINLNQVRQNNKIVYQNAGASVLDIGEDVLCLEIHTEPINMIDPDVITAGAEAIRRGEKNFRGIVIGNGGKQFCSGANLMLLAMHIEAKNWKAIENMLTSFQDLVQRLRYAQVPVVSAPFGLTLGGGAELAMAANHIHASMETYMGLVEVGVGLIPAGGGCLNMLKRYLASTPTSIEYDQMPIVRHVFEIIGQAKTSSSGKDARKKHFLTSSDTITLNPDRQLYEARELVKTLWESNWRAPEVWRDFHLPGEGGVAMLKYGLKAWKDNGVISEYDAVVGEKLAQVLCGGKAAFRTDLSEEYILELEREAFLSLCGNEKTMDRIQHMLKTKKPLRN